MIDTVYVGAASACFELKNTTPYYAPAPYEVLLNGMTVLRGEANVFSLHGLWPSTAYRLTVRMDGAAFETAFTTAAETCALNVKDFGAAGDGVTDDTAAIQRAVLVLPAGGRLVFPAGVYCTAPILLKSHMTLELRQGAVLLGAADKQKYPVLPGLAADLNGGEPVETGAFEGMARDMYAALITAEYAEDITLIGPGLVDGNAQKGEWWRTYRQDPVARPRLFFFNRCKNVTVHGIRAANAASWQFHPYNCQDVRFYDVSVDAPKDSPNTDALDPESCDGVEIVGCRFSVGDDCIAIKSGKIDPARPCKAAARRHTIRNCLMAYGHGAVTLGSEISGGVQEMSVSQCLFKQTDRGLRIKTRRGRGKGCDIEDVAFDNIRMEGVLTPIVINMWYNCVDPDGNSEYVQGRQKLPVDERTPHLGAFRFSGMTCSDAEVSACYVDGLPEMPIDSVTLKDVRISFKKDAQNGVPAMLRDAVPRRKMGLYFDNVKRVTLQNVTLAGVEGAPLTALHVDSIVEENFAEVSDVRQD